VTMVNTRDGIAFFQLLSIRGRLQIEVNTGLTSRVSSLKAAKQLYGVFSNTKKGALAEVEAYMKGWQYAAGVIDEKEAMSFPGARGTKNVNKVAFIRGFNKYHELVGTPGYVPQ
jgi:hypothetical protein